MKATELTDYRNHSENKFVGKIYIAASATNNKLKICIKALEWTEKSHKLLLLMKAEGTLPEFDYKLISEVEAQINDIKNKLGKSS